MRFIFVLIYFYSINLYAETFRALTFNTGLAHGYVPLAEQRLAPISKALANTNADVICLQEVWEEKDKNYLIEQLKANFPHQLSKVEPNLMATHSPACKVGDLFGSDKVFSCIVKNCRGLEGDQFTTCFLQKCGAPMQALKKSNRLCAQALTAQVGVSTFKAILNLLHPFKEVPLFTYGGSNGLLLLSRHPLVEDSPQYLSMRNISNLTNRGALFAKIQRGEQEVAIGCTHLTANLDDVPYTGEFDSWEKENLKQTQVLFEYANNYAGNANLSLVMGDFNFGPTILDNNITGEAEESYKLVPKFLYFEQPTTLSNCTFCANNLILQATKNFVIDHIFVKGQYEAKDFKQNVLLDGPISVEVNGQQVQTQLSDHYAVELSIDSL